ncbi:hypothetical protein [Caulobacter sp. S45]|uniref:hypothetical protein n=1 Tax=Caulobacter sp. S45 TaxID=1641861 RepID=UPI00157683FE|nr:hypothetical protein [Caulobacter sp. S45]
MIKRMRGIWRAVLVMLGLILIPLGLVGAVLPTHLLGVLLVLGLILVLRNSIRWRRRFIHIQRRFPRYGYPVRRLLRGEVLPVVWHELLRSERFFIPRQWRRLRRTRTAWRQRRARLRRTA